MWPMCTETNSWWLLLPLLLGLLCGWWAWARRRAMAMAGGADMGSMGGRPAMPDAAPVANFKAPDPAPMPAPAMAPIPAADPAPKPMADPDAGMGMGAAAGAAGMAGAAMLAIGIPAAVGGPDDLLKIKGIGPKLNGVLNGLGVTRFDQIAAWTPGDVDKVDDHLGEFKDRIGREEWIPQAKLLSIGQHDEWERIYGTVKRAAGVGAAAMLAIGIPGAVGDPDDLLQIKGIGPKLNALLVGLGITRFDQIAAWGASEIDKVDDHLGTFKNRITRDSWVEQAGLLATGAIAEFEAKFGKLDSENKK